MDFYLFNLINQFAGKNACLDSTAIFFAEYFQYIVVFFLFLFLVKKFRKYLKMVISALGAAVSARFIIVEIIRHLILRARPFVENNINLLVIHNPNEASFPSGHAAFFFAIAAVVYFYNKKAGVVFFTASFLISISRVFVGIHWPSDILAGAIVGIFSGWLVVRLTRKLIKSK
jgi:undecaprenyl-diphosphatase